MTKKEILEGNKLIAEFLDYEQEDWDDEPIRYNVIDHLVCTADGIDYWETTEEDWTSWITSDEMKYHSSWDWLMPICYKISEIIKDKYNIENLNPLDELFDRLSGGLYYTNDDLKVSTNITEVYTDVIIFIKWYNFQ